MSKRKRGQREGSIYRRADGYWVAALSLGGGKRRVVYARTFDEALSKREEERAAMQRGENLSRGKGTVGQLLQEWLESKSGTVRPKTHERYASLIKCHTADISGIRLTKLQVTDLEHLYRSRQRVVSAKTIRHLHFVIKAALTWAVARGERLGVSLKNPASSITRDELPRIQRKPIRVLSNEECRSLLNAAAGTKAEGLITFALVTGARIGEIMGLTWDRIDLESGEVQITHSLQYLDGEATLVEPKTQAGTRRIVLPTFAAKLMKAHRAEQNQTALRLGPAWSNDLNLAFVKESGAPLNRHAVLRQYLRPTLRKAGLPTTLRVHDLRHGAESLMLAKGVPIPVVSELLGHANPHITSTLYLHALPNSQQMVAEQMEAAFAGN